MVIQRLSEPRIAPLPITTWDPELRERFERPGGLGRILNVMTTLANHSGLFKRWVIFANHFLFKSTLSLRDRESLILRTGWLAGCEYEWGQHLKIAAEDCGFGDTKFDAIAEGASALLWGPAEAALIRAADGIYIDAFVDDDTWETLASYYHPPQLFDIVFMVSNYLMLAMGLNAFGVQLDVGFTGFRPGLPMNHRRPSDKLPPMAVRHPTPRVATLADAECTPAQLDLLTKARGHLASVNVLDTLIRHPDLLRRWMPFFVHVLHKSSLSARDREMLILRTGRLCGAEYEWSQHVPFAERAGLSSDEIRGIAEGDTATVWRDEHERNLMRAVEQLHRYTMIDDSLWQALANRYHTHQMMDLVFTVGQYRLVSAGLNSLCVQLDDYLQPYAAT